MLAVRKSVAISDISIINFVTENIERTFANSSERIDVHFTTFPILTTTIIFLWKLSRATTGLA
ncbi:MAG: hypothetical protein O2U61_06750 [Candidatus Bathyarchaeota archaeon]|nr:hypothetical protein [Candidatus Bathyarchaeota archaeon]